MNAEKKTWHRPELTVLVRSRPEEAVLGPCKHAGNAGGPTVLYGSCARKMSNVPSCSSSCSAQSRS